MHITNKVLKFSRRMHAIPDLSSCKGYIDLADLKTTAANIIIDAMK